MIIRTWTFQRMPTTMARFELLAFLLFNCWLKLLRILILNWPRVFIYSVFFYLHFRLKWHFFVHYLQTGFIRLSTSMCWTGKQGLSIKNIRSLRDSLLLMYVWKCIRHRHIAQSFLFFIGHSSQLLKQNRWYGVCVWVWLYRLQFLLDKRLIVIRIEMKIKEKVPAATRKIQTPNATRKTRKTSAINLAPEWFLAAE